MWDRSKPGLPIWRFPRTDEGWGAAWSQFVAMEPRLENVPSAEGPPKDILVKYAPPGGWRSALAWLGVAFGFLAYIVPGFFALKSVRRWKRRAIPRPTFAWVMGGAIGPLFVVLGVIGYLSLGESKFLLEEHFSSAHPAFTTDSDRFVDFSVADGAYHILIKDGSSPQTARHIFHYTRHGLRIESTVTMPRQSSFFSVGCWNGDGAYLLVLLDTGEVGLFENVTPSERRALTDPIRTDAVRPPGEPNRLRIDCVGGSRKPTIVSSWVNGKPVFSVAVSDGVDSFDAVGFLVAAEADGTEFVVDDVLVVAERPPPAKSPVPAIET